MKKKVHIFILLLTIGFFLLPNLNYACGTKTEKSCSPKEVSSKAQQNDCCNGEHSKDKDNNCGGKCGHSNCTTSSVIFSILSLNEIQFKNNSFDFSTEKPKFYNSKTFISSGFTSVWLPPNIK